jgi:hypothetical protein
VHEKVKKLSLPKVSLERIVEFIAQVEHEVEVFLKSIVVKSSRNNEFVWHHNDCFSM